MDSQTFRYVVAGETTMTFFSMVEMDRRSSRISTTIDIQTVGNGVDFFVYNMKSVIIFSA